MHTRQKVDWSIIPVSLSILYHTLSSSTDRMLSGRLSLTACESNYFLIKIREKEKKWHSTMHKSLSNTVSLKVILTQNIREIRKLII